MERSPKIGKEVIEGGKAGDENAFAEIVLTFQKKVFNIAFRMLGNRVVSGGLPFRFGVD
jgi:hypothetical protein